jgi:hypothetical protein
MKRTIIIISICVLGITANAQKNLRYIFFYDPNTSLSENNLYEKTKGYFDFEAQYNNLKNANVSADVSRAIAHKDRRFIALSGKIKYAYPGVTAKEEVLIRKYNFKVIQGIGASVKNKNAPPLQAVASTYAMNYNKQLLLKINAGVKH